MKFTIDGVDLNPCPYCIVNGIPASDQVVFISRNSKIPLIKHLRGDHFLGLSLLHAKMMAEVIMGVPIMISGSRQAVNDSGYIMDSTGAARLLPMGSPFRPA